MRREIILSTPKSYLDYSMVLGLEQVSWSTLSSCKTHFTGWTCCNVVSQQWLDKKRAELNPYLLLGAPIVCISSLPLFNWLCQTYTWSGACLISAGITLNCAIVILLFDRNMDGHVHMYKISRMLKSQTRVSVRKTQRLQTKAGWKSNWNVQQPRTKIKFEF